MNTKNTLIKELENLPDNIVAEVLDFVRFLELKNSDKQELLIQSKSSLKKDWLLPAEDEAWKNL